MRNNKPKCTVLVVDDNLSILTFVSELLGAVGYDILRANAGAEALRISRDFRGRIQLLVSDVQMPGMSGQDLAIAVTVDRPDLKVLLMSGLTAEALVLKDGWHFMAKPIAAPELLELVTDLVSDESINRANRKSKTLEKVE